MVTQKIETKDKPFHVIHSNGDIVAGFDDQQSAIDDATDRNIKARELNLEKEGFYAWSRR